MLDRGLRICLLSGGTTAEAAASRASARGLHAALRSSGHDVVWLDLSEAGAWRTRSEHRPVEATSSGAESSSWRGALVALLRAHEVELVFPAIHGPIGEDGQLQQLCESLRMPYVGCDAAASIACYDKARFKQMARAASLPAAACIAVERSAHEADPRAVAAMVARELGYPCIVKPSRSGSSLGLARVEAADELDAAIGGALLFDDVVLVEQLFPGIDVEIGVLGNGTPVVGSPVELEYEGPLYDFETKYAGDRDTRYLPARFSAALRSRLARVAHAAYIAAGCHGLARVDLLVDPSSERFIVNEINTLPYMPESSTFATSLCHATGQTYLDLVTTLVQFAWMPRTSNTQASSRWDAPPR